MTARSRPLGIAGMLIATSAWGSLFIVGQPVLAHVDPVWLTLVRYTIASVGFAALLLARGTFPWARLRAHAPRLALLGFVGYGMFGALVLIGLRHSVPSHGAVIMATMPITTQLVRWLLDGAPPTRASLAATALAVAGVVMVSGVWLAPAGAGSTLFGDALAYAGTLGWIVYTRGAARVPELDALEYSGLTALASWPLLLAGALAGAALGWTPAPSSDDLAVSWHALLYLGIVPSVVAVPAYNYGIRSLGLVAGAAFLNMVPVSAVLMSAALGRPPSLHELAGVALVGSGLLIHALTPARRDHQRASASRVSSTPMAQSRSTTSAGIS